MAAAVDAVRIQGDWIRHAPHRSDLLGRSPVPADGRWQRGDEIRGLYLADGTATAVAEWYRGLAERGLPPAQAIPHDHHVWRLDLALADLRTASRLAALGLAPPVPGRRTWSAYQAVGGRLHREGWRGIVAPSAARPAALVVCVFDDGWPPAGCVPRAAVEISHAPAPPPGMTT